MGSLLLYPFEKRIFPQGGELFPAGSYCFWLQPLSDILDEFFCVVSDLL